MSAGAGHLLVRAGGRVVGLPLAQVVEVLDPGTAFPVPSVEPSVRASPSSAAACCRWSTSARCSRAARSPERSEMGVLVEVGGRRLCLEIEEADSVLYEPACRCRVAARCRGPQEWPAPRKD